jgi:hypothetical protein
MVGLLFFTDHPETLQQVVIIYITVLRIIVVRNIFPVGFQSSMALYFIVFLKKLFPNFKFKKMQQTQKSGSTTSERSMMTGMFSDRDSVEKSYRSLQDRGYTKDEINVIMSDETRKKHFAKGETEVGTKTLEGAGAGSVIGGAIGAAAGIIAAIGTSVAIPGLGLLIAGPLAAGLAGAGAGGAAGGLIGALVGSGMTEERARLYESGVKNGKVVMGVHPKNEEDADYFEKEWRTNKAEDIYR